MITKLYPTGSFDMPSDRGFRALLTRVISRVFFLSGFRPLFLCSLCDQTPACVDCGDFDAVPLV